MIAGVCGILSVLQGKDMTETENKTEKKPENKSETKAKKTNKRRAYLNDFKLQDNGEYAYKGYVYVYQGDWKQNRKQFWGLCAALAALVIAAGLIPSGGMINTFYVILPFVGELITAALFLYAVYRFTSRDERIRSYIFEKTYDRFNGYFLFLFIFSVMSIAGEIIHLIFTRPLERVGMTLVFIAIQFLVFGITAALNRHVQAMKFVKVKEK